MKVADPKEDEAEELDLNFIHCMLLYEFKIYSMRYPDTEEQI